MAQPMEGQNEPLVIVPAEAALTAGQVAHFTVTGAPADTITWAVDPNPTGAFQSGVFIAPARIDADFIHTITATAPDGRRATALCRLVPIKVTVTPSKVTLNLEEQQQFTAFVSNDPSNSITWTVAPTVGTLTNGLFTAPHSIAATETIAVTATSKLDPSQSANAQVTLVKPKLMPVQERVGFGIALVILGILLSASIVAYWPLSNTDVDAAAKASDAASKALKTKQDQVAKATQESQKANEALAAKQGDPTLKAAADDKSKALAAAQTDVTAAQREADDKSKALKDAQDASVNYLGFSQTRTAGSLLSMPRELNYLVIALIMGALGSFIHTAKSFGGFAGNRTLVASWAWWYVLHPLIGMTLALIFYVVVRGGFFATGAGPSAVNPYGIAAVCGLVGMFSKQATDKLNELFCTLFKTSEDAQRKDKMTSQQPPQTAPSTPPTPVSGQATAATAGKQP